MSLVNALYDFRQGISEVNNYISMAFKEDGAGDDIFDDIKKDFLISSSFLKMFIYWESFIEEAFSKYLMGEASIDNTAVICYASPRDRPHALKMLIGTQKYVDWANHEIIRRLANLYFENGNPFGSNISAVAGELADLKTIRNAAAHLSSTTQAQLDALASRVLNQPIHNTSVSKFVMHMHALDNTKTVLQYYQIILDIVAENIATNRT